MRRQRNRPGTRARRAPACGLLAGGRKNRGAKPETSAEPAADANTVWLHAVAESADQDSGGMIDATAVADEPYSYTAVRSRDVTLNGHKLELRSDPSAAVRAARDRGAATRAGAQ